VAFFRFSRDKRGYEHFYLVEPVTNRKGKSRPRVLYWYRTPPNVKVGRPPFDDEMRRAIEAQYPDVTFEWNKIVEAPIPSADAEKWRERRRAERAERVARRSNAAVDADEESESTEETDPGASIDEEPIDAELPSTVTADAEPGAGPLDGGWHEPVAGQVPPSPDAADTADAAPTAPAAAGETPAQPGGDSPHGGRKRRRRRRGRGHPAASASGAVLPVGAAESPIDTPESVADHEPSDDPIDEPSGE
jgi:hypothetical protein